MSRSLRSIAVVVCSLFLAFGGTWLYLREKAAAKPIKSPFEHAFLKTVHEGGKPAIFVRVKTPSELKALPTQTPEKKLHVGVWLDVRLAGSDLLLISPAEVLPKPPGVPVEVATAEQAREAGLFELADFYDAINGRPTILNLIARRPGLSQKILEIWGDGKPLSISSTLIQSEADGHLKELREAQPRGLYGSSQSVLIQMEVLATLGLASLMDLNSDVLISSIAELRHGVYVPRVREATLNEAHRRGLKRYAGPASSKNTVDELLNAGYDGILIDDPAILDSF